MSQFLSLIDLSPAQFFLVEAIIIALLPLAIMFVLIVIFSEKWVEYIRAKFFLKEGFAMVEIKLPKETMKSPASMELFLTALHQTSGEGDWYARYWLGKTRAWFSLELVSIEGQIHFFIWMRKSFKNFISTSLYAQFPGIEVHDAADYAQSVHFDPAKVALWARELQFTKQYNDRMTSAYPIKSYIDYGLDKDPKEEFKVDPIAPLIEFLGSIGANQQAWVQIFVRAYKKDDHVKPGHFWKTHDRWREDGKAIINEEIHLRDPKTKVAGEADEETGFSKAPRVTKGEEEVASAIERNIAKLGFDVGIRLMYIAKKDNFNPANIGGMLGSWKQFNAEHLNGFKPNGDLWEERISYPWHDFGDRRKNKYCAQALAMFKRRSFFYKPYTHIYGHSKPMVMSSESLATIYHFPGQVVATPTLARVPSKKGEAPANIPV